MNVQFHYKLSKPPDVESHIDLHIQKLQKRLQVFNPDMVALYGSVAEHPKLKGGFVVSLNLRLPSGQMAAKAASETLQAAIKRAFDDLLEQLEEHKRKLRAEYKWPRQRRTGRRDFSEVPFERTLAAVRLEPVTPDDIRNYIDTNLGRFMHFVEREIRHRRDNGAGFLNQVRPEEVVDEAIMYALDDRKERPEKMALEPWLYRMARYALGRISRQNEPRRGAIPLDGPYGETQIENRTLMPDRRVATPEEIRANDEIADMVAESLRGSLPEDRESFILYTFEGFTIDEIAAITEHSASDVRQSIGRARERVRKSIRIDDPLKQTILNHSRIA